MLSIKSKYHAPLIYRFYLPLNCSEGALTAGDTLLISRFFKLLLIVDSLKKCGTIITFWFPTGGYLAHSLAIMTDAAHLLTDFGSMMVSLFSLWISSRPPTKTMNFGWHRSGQNQSSDVPEQMSGWMNNVVHLFLCLQKFKNLGLSVNSKPCHSQPTLYIVPPAGNKFYKCNFHLPYLEVMYVRQVQNQSDND